MNIKLTVVFFIFVSFHLSAQKDTTSNSEKEFEIIENMTKPQELEKDEKVIINYKKMPEFPGGVNALMEFITTNVKYPKEIRRAGIKGVVHIRFEVNKEGNIGKVEIQKGVHDLLDAEAIKVVRKLPKFKPGEQNGKKVNVWYSLPVRFGNK